MSSSTSSVTNPTNPTGIPDLSSTLKSTGGVAAAPSTQDQFMKLFIAQLQNQDSLSPQDSTAFLAQLAQMSQLEQTTETNTKLQSLADQQAAANRASLSEMVGKNVSANADTIDVRDGTQLGAPGGPQLSVQTNLDAKSLEFDVVDASGKTVKSIDLGPHAAGTIQLDESKLGTLPTGKLSLVVKGKAADGTDISGTTTIAGKIDAMQISDSGASFRMGPFNISPANVTSVGAATP